MRTCVMREGRVIARRRAADKRKSALARTYLFFALTRPAELQPEQSASMFRALLGRRQAVRQWILIPPCGGSNPPAPANSILSFEPAEPCCCEARPDLTTFKSNRHHGRACPGKAPPTLLRCKEPARVECVTALGGSGGVCHGQPDYRSSKSRP